MSIIAYTMSVKHPPKASPAFFFTFSYFLKLRRNAGTSYDTYREVLPHSRIEAVTKDFLCLKKMYHNSCLFARVMVHLISLFRYCRFYLPKVFLLKSSNTQVRISFSAADTDASLILVLLPLK